MVLSRFTLISCHPQRGHNGPQKVHIGSPISLVNQIKRKPVHKPNGISRIVEIKRHSYVSPNESTSSSVPALDRRLAIRRFLSLNVLIYYLC